MKSEGFAYEKLILYAYPQLIPLAASSERAAENKALLSFRSFERADVAAERVAEELRVAAELRILREEVKALLPKFTLEEQFLLEYKYFRRRDELKKFGEVTFAFSERSYFRRQRALIEKVSRLFKKVGITEENFRRRFSSYEPFRRILKALEEGRERAIPQKRKHRAVRFQNSTASSLREVSLPRRSSAEITTETTHARTIATMCPADSPVPFTAADGSAGAAVR